jgi:hypothetical protein
MYKSTRCSRIQVGNEWLLAFLRGRTYAAVDQDKHFVCWHRTPTTRLLQLKLMMPRPSSNPTVGSDKDSTFLSPAHYDEDAVSLHDRSDQDSDSEDDELLAAARNSRELRARDRLVLMEEEEMDKLVEDARKKQRGRSSSGLSVPNPLRMLSRNRSQSSIEEPKDDRRQIRRDRRKHKRERLMKEAQHGEDAELMYEMEEAGLKDGSSTGNSSDRDGSDELDRRHLLNSGSAIQQRRKWRRWVFIHTMIAAGFAFLVLLAWKISVHKRRETPQPVSNGTALFAPTTLIISLDGFRADFLQRGLTPRLSAFIKEGVSPLYMLPSFPSVTFPVGLSSGPKLVALDLTVVESLHARDRAVPREPRRGGQLLLGSGSRGRVLLHGSGKEHGSKVVGW